MKDIIETEVSTSTLPVWRDESRGRITVDRMGDMIGMDWRQRIVNMGRGYNFANITPDTLITGSSSYVATDPALLIVVPTGHTMVPISVCVDMENMAGTDNHVTIGFDTSDLYSSGGLAGSMINNLRTDDAFPSPVVKAYNGSTAIVMTDPAAGERIIYHWCDAFADADTKSAPSIVWEPKYSPVLVGPASFFVYVYAATTSPDFQYSVQWVEFPTEAIPD